MGRDAWLQLKSQTLDPPKLQTLPSDFAIPSQSGDQVLTEATLGPWTVLPEGFKTSSSLFDEHLAKDLQALWLDQGIFLQYVDDLLIASPNYEHCLSTTIIVLNHLMSCRYKVSTK